MFLPIDFTFLFVTDGTKRILHLLFNYYNLMKPIDIKLDSRQRSNSSYPPSFSLNYSSLSSSVISTTSSYSSCCSSLYPATISSSLASTYLKKWSSSYRLRSKRSIHSNQDGLSVSLNVTDHPLKPNDDPKPIVKICRKQSKTEVSLIRTLVNTVSLHIKPYYPHHHHHCYHYHRHQEKPRVESIEKSSIIPLTTYSEVKIALPSSSINTSREIVSHRSREPRINPNYLRMYAVNTSARHQGMLPVTDAEIDAYDVFQNEADPDQCFVMPLLSNITIHDYDDDDFFPDEISTTIPSYTNLLKIASISRRKLWNDAILSPRQDFVDQTCNDQPICCNWDDLKLKPWERFDEFEGAVASKLDAQSAFPVNCRFKPHGLIPNTNIQYTIKGYEVSRWKDVC